MTYEPTQEEIDEAANDAWYSYYLLRDRPEMANDRHRDKIAEDAWFSHWLVRSYPEQANDAIREKAKECKND